MNEAITWEHVTVLATVGGLAGAAWWFLFRHILNVRKELQELRLEVAKEYVSREILKEMESRFFTALKELKQEFHAVPDRLASVIATMIKSQQDK